MGMNVLMLTKKPLLFVRVEGEQSGFGTEMLQ